MKAIIQALAAHSVQCVNSCRLVVPVQSLCVLCTVVWYFTALRFIGFVVNLISAQYFECQSELVCVSVCLVCYLVEVGFFLSYGGVYMCYDVLCGGVGCAVVIFHDVFTFLCLSKLFRELFSSSHKSDRCGQSRREKRALNLQFAPFLLKQPICTERIRCAISVSMCGCRRKACGICVCT